MWVGGTLGCGHQVSPPFDFWLLTLDFRLPNLDKPEAKSSTAKLAKRPKKNKKTFALFAFLAVKICTYSGYLRNHQRLDRADLPGRGQA